MISLDSPRAPGSVPPPSHDPPDCTIRISSLSTLARCPSFAMADSLEHRGSAAADLGSFIGRLVGLWHEYGEDVVAVAAAREQACREQPVHWPQAKVEEGLRVFGLYTCDERNYGVVVKGSCEREVRLTLDPAPEDPTGRPIRLVGHLDQVRRERVGDRYTGRFHVWDGKHSASTGEDLVFNYAWQLAAYSLAASESYGVPILPGGIIRTQGYGVKCVPAEAKDARVFFETPWSLEACKSMLATAVQHIAWLRAGLFHLQPGAHCGWCPAGGPASCGDFLASRFSSGVKLS